MRQSSNFGASLVELMLALALFGFLATGVIGAVIYGQVSTANSGDRTRAVQLADEGIQAIRNIKSAGFANLNDGTFGLSRSSGVWQLAGTSDTTGMFSRSVSVSSVDSSKKTITSTVIWNTTSGPKQVSIDTQVTNWAAIVKSWASAGIFGTSNLGNNTDAVKVATQGNYAYVVMASGNPDFYVIDIADRSNPTVVGTFGVSGSPTNIAVSGDYVYISTTSNNSELVILDVSNPSNVSLASSFNAPGVANATGVRVVGNTVYLSRTINLFLFLFSYGELQIIDVTNKNSPTQLSSPGIYDNVYDVCVSGNFAYLARASDNSEVSVYDISNPSSPVGVANLDLPTSNDPSALRCEANRLYVAQNNVLRVVDTTNPSIPLLIGSIATIGGGTINDVDIIPGKKAALLATANPTGEFQVVNTANPTQMTITTVDVNGTNSTLRGIAYNASLDTAAGVGASNNQELVLFGPN